MRSVLSKTLWYHATVLLYRVNRLFPPLLIFARGTLINKTVELVECKSIECGICLIVHTKLIKPFWVANGDKITIVCRFEVGEIPGHHNYFLGHIDLSSFVIDERVAKLFNLFSVSLLQFRRYSMKRYLKWRCCWLGLVELRLHFNVLWAWAFHSSAFLCF